MPRTRPPTPGTAAVVARAAAADRAIDRTLAPAQPEPHRFQLELEHDQPLELPSQLAVPACVRIAATSGVPAQSSPEPAQLSLQPRSLSPLPSAPAPCVSFAAASWRTDCSPAQSHLTAARFIGTKSRDWDGSSKSETLCRSAYSIAPWRSRIEKRRRVRRRGDLRQHPPVVGHLDARPNWCATDLSDRLATNDIDSRVTRSRVRDRIRLEQVVPHERRRPPVGEIPLLGAGRLPSRSNLTTIPPRAPYARPGHRLPISQPGSGNRTGREEDGPDPRSGPSHSASPRGRTASRGRSG